MKHRFSTHLSFDLENIFENKVYNSIKYEYKTYC